MAEARVMEGKVSEVTVEELFKAQGADYSRRAPRPEMVELNLQILEEAFPLGPGHSYWKGLEDVRSIISFLKGEQIGISLTASDLMLPKKSIVMVIGVGSHLPDLSGKTHCDFCHLKGNCNMRNFSLSNC